MLPTGFYSENSWWIKSKQKKTTWKSSASQLFPRYLCDFKSIKNYSCPKFNFKLLASLLACSIFWPSLLTLWSPVSRVSQNFLLRNGLVNSKDKNSNLAYTFHGWCSWFNRHPSYVFTVTCLGVLEEAISGQTQFSSVSRKTIMHMFMRAYNQ